MRNATENGRKRGTSEKKKVSEEGATNQPKHTGCVTRIVRAPESIVILLPCVRADSEESRASSRMERCVEEREGKTTEVKKCNNDNTRG